VPLSLKRRNSTHLGYREGKGNYVSWRDGAPWTGGEGGEKGENPFCRVVIGTHFDDGGRVGIKLAGRDFEKRRKGRPGHHQRPFEVGSARREKLRRLLSQKGRTRKHLPLKAASLQEASGGSGTSSGKGGSIKSSLFLVRVWREWKWGEETPAGTFTNSF